MKRISWSIFTLFAILVLAAGCNLPADSNPTPAVFSTPNATLTALFNTPPPKVVTATFPPLQTATPQPATPTKVIPSATGTAQSRAGGSVDAVYFAAPPAIDGDWNDYTSLEYPAEVIVYGLSSYTDRNDLAGSFRLGWDAQNLYLAVKIRDEKYVQNATGEELFKGDSLEVLLDADLQGDFAQRVLNNDDFQLGISLGSPSVKNAKEAYLWFPQTKKGAVLGVKAAATRDDTTGLTRAEVAIPWSVFGITPNVGDRFGFVFSISDNDDPFTSAQQSLASSVKTRNLVDPTSWGELLLGK